MADGNQRHIRQNFVLSRERSFVRPPSQFHQYLYHPPILQKQRPRTLDLQQREQQNKAMQVKPTMEIYRPPNSRADGGPEPRLNVHAKEFTMNNHYNQLQNSRSSGNIVVMDPPYYQQMMHKLQGSMSSPRVHFCLQPTENAEVAAHQHKSAFKPPDTKTRHHNTSPDNAKQVRFQPVNVVAPALPPLQRSKSLGAADVLARQHSAIQDSASELGSFPSDIQNAVTKASQDPNSVPPRILMELVRGVMERVLESRKYAEPAAKLCINIIERERKETFLESLLNTCQQWYQERERLLRTPTSSKVPAFMAFLNEMYCQLKRRQLQLRTQQEGVPPGLVLLTLLCKCCQDCLKPPAVTSLSEMESLFFVLTAIGKDLEQELPAQLEGLLTGVRDAFLTAKTLPAIRKTLLQLIELSAAKWQLPAPAVMYYYPGTYK